MSRVLSYVDVPTPQEATQFRHHLRVSEELEGSGESTDLRPSGGTLHADYTLWS